LCASFCIDRNTRRKKVKNTYPLTLLYDANCPVCALEMDHLRERNKEAKLVFVDISAKAFDPTPFGATFEAMDAEIHGVLPDGTVMKGVEVLRLAYAAAGLGWVMRPTGWAPLKPLFDMGYRVFARHRRRISGAAAPLIGAVRALRARSTAKRMQACARGACATPDAANTTPRRPL
jgi:predicted DCC family thiol-disulfide oxidoreductase YuxK